MSYAHTLASELDRQRLPRRLQRRILAEIEDHLCCDPEAELGDPEALARQFADELGTSRARRAAVLAFLGLVVAGVGLSVAVVAQAGGSLSRALTSGPSVSDLGAGAMVVAAQVAFVAGVLAVLRAFRLRGASALPRAEARILLRRAGVRLAAGVAAMAGLALAAIGLRGHIEAWWVTLALIAAGTGGVALLAASPGVVTAARLMPSQEGSAGDLFEDLGSLVPTELRHRPWRFAVAVATIVAVLIVVAGALQADGFDGALRGLADGAACLVGFGVLGRYLGLRR